MKDIKGVGSVISPRSGQIVWVRFASGATDVGTGKYLKKTIFLLFTSELCDSERKSDIKNENC